jgi:hypothetical protein
MYVGEPIGSSLRGDPNEVLDIPSHYLFDLNTIQLPPILHLAIIVIVWPRFIASCCPNPDQQPVTLNTVESTTCTSDVTEKRREERKGRLRSDHCSLLKTNHRISSLPYLIGIPGPAAPICCSR